MQSIKHQNSSMLCERHQYGSIWLSGSMLAQQYDTMLCSRHQKLYGSISLHHASIIMAQCCATMAHAICYQASYVAQCCASCINMASIICIMHQYGSVLCIRVRHQNYGSILCTMAQSCASTAHWCASGINNMTQCCTSGINMAQYCASGIKIMAQSCAPWLNAVHPRLIDVHQASIIIMAQCCASGINMCIKHPL